MKSNLLDMTLNEISFYTCGTIKQDKSFKVTFMRVIA